MLEGNKDQAVGNLELGNRLAHHRGARTNLALDDLVTILSEAYDSEDVLHVETLFDGLRDDVRLVNGDVDAHRLVEHPGICRVVHTGDDAIHAVLHLGEHSDHEVDLVIARYGNNDAGLEHAGLFEDIRLEPMPLTTEPSGSFSSRRCATAFLDSTM